MVTEGVCAGHPSDQSAPVVRPQAARRRPPVLLALAAPLRLRRHVHHLQGLPTPCMSITSPARYPCCLMSARVIAKRVEREVFECTVREAWPSCTCNLRESPRNNSRWIFAAGRSTTTPSDRCSSSCSPPALPSPAARSGLARSRSPQHSQRFEHKSQLLSHSQHVEYQSQVLSHSLNSTTRTTL